MSPEHIRGVSSSHHISTSPRLCFLHRSAAAEKRETSQRGRNQTAHLGTLSWLPGLSSLAVVRFDNTPPRLLLFFSLSVCFTTNQPSTSRRSPNSAVTWNINLGSGAPWALSIARVNLQSLTDWIILKATCVCLTPNLTLGCRLMVRTYLGRPR